MSEYQHCEVINIIVRGGPEYTRPGDPFTWVCYLARNDKDRAYVLAMIGSPTITEFRRVREELRDIGIRHLDYTRISGKQGEFNFNESRN